MTPKTLPSTLEQTVLEALSQHDFFEPSTAPDGRRVYQSATKHILEVIPQDGKYTLAVRVTVNDAGLIVDLLRLVPAFCQAFDPTWADALDWLNHAMKQYELLKRNDVHHRNGVFFVLKAHPEFGYIYVVAQQNAESKSD